MIRARNAKAYCCEDISLIENYKQAVNDKTQMWHCHHRKETDEGLSRAELIEMGLYWKRPASELIFLTKAEHSSLHHKGKYVSAEYRAKIGTAKKGKHLSAEHRANMRKPKSAEHRAKIGAANAKAVYQIHKATGIIIREWKCISDVTRVLGIPQSSIVNCCRGRIKTAYGFIWRYVDVH